MDIIPRRQRSLDLVSGTLSRRLKPGKQDSEDEEKSLLVKSLIIYPLGSFLEEQCFQRWDTSNRCVCPQKKDVPHLSCYLDMISTLCLSLLHFTTLPELSLAVQRRDNKPAPGDDALFTNSINLLLSPSYASTYPGNQQSNSDPTTTQGSGLEEIAEQIQQLEELDLEHGLAEMPNPDHLRIFGWVTCRACGVAKAKTLNVQDRSADEGMTTYVVCTYPLCGAVYVSRV